MVIKKAFVLLIISVLTISTGNAQRYFVGGSLGVNFQDGDLPQSYFGFNFTPKAGYYINDNFAVGLGLNLMSFFNNFSSSNQSSDMNTTQTRWGLSAFSRYNMWKLGKFSLILEGVLDGSIGTFNSEITNVQTDDFVSSSFGINIVPLLSYSLTDRWSIESEFKFMSLGFNTTIDKDTSTRDKTIKNSFGLGINDNWEPFKCRVGLIFKF